MHQDPIPIQAATVADHPDNQPIGYTPCPANLAGMKDAYAIYVVGDEMSPRYEPGWLLHVNPHKPASPGRDVVITMRDGARLIRRVIRGSDGVLELHQLNPEATVCMARDDIVACDLIVGVDQEG